MPRSKQAPSRKRPLSEAEDDSLAAQIVSDLEVAEIEAVRARHVSGAAREMEEDEECDGDSPFAGLVRLRTLADDDLDALRRLHDVICERLGGSLAGWGGSGDTSGRQRGYGYLQGYPLGERHYLMGHSMREYSGAAAAADAAANRRASVLLTPSEVPPGVDRALHNLTEALRPRLPSAYTQFASPSMLVAAQPNLHNGRAYLRPHLDEPLHDGFGVLIVTIAISGSARILLTSQPWEEAGAPSRKEAWFRLRANEAYALSGAARNVCTHGVLADEGAEARQSLNLRFGLHAAQPNEPLSAWQEIERHWPIGIEPGTGREQGGARPTGEGGSGPV